MSAFKMTSFARPGDPPLNGADWFHFLAVSVREAHIAFMSAQRVSLDQHDGDDILDADTSAAILRWMETALLPDGIDAERWERWLDGGCKERIEACGVAVTPAMLGNWARSGSLR